MKKAKSTGSQADALLAQSMRVEGDGSLAQHVREVVATNRARPPGTPR